MEILAAAGLLAAPAARLHRTRHDVYVRLSDEDVAKTRGSWDGVNVDLDEDHQVVGVEILAAVEITIDGHPVTAPTPTAARPHVNETSTGGYLARERIPGETYQGATAAPETATPPADTDVTVYIGIGNSDNKLTQQEWARFCAGIDGYIRSVATQFLGEWHSLPNAAWQNAEYAAVVPADRMDDVRAVLGRYRDQYRQDSIALAVVDRTEFI